MSIERNKVYHQVYRVGDSSLERWELYVGEDQMPDFDGSGQPVATSTSLPFNYTPDPADSGQTKVLYCVVRKRNQFNLLSHNQYPTLIEIDDLGDEELGPITSPEIIEVTDGDAGEIFVHARYPRDVDRNEADTWDVYVEDGVDPDPDIHTPKATVSMGKPGVDYMLKQSVTGLTPGDTVHVMVVARRASESGSGEEGESTVTQHSVAQTYDVDGLQTDFVYG